MRIDLGAVHIVTITRDLRHMTVGTFPRHILAVRWVNEFNLWNKRNAYRDFAGVVSIDKRFAHQLDLNIDPEDEDGSPSEVAGSIDHLFHMLDQTIKWDAVQCPLPARPIRKIPTNL